MKLENIVRFKMTLSIRATLIGRGEKGSHRFKPASHHIMCSATFIILAALTGWVLENTLLSFITHTKHVKFIERKIKLFEWDGRTQKLNTLFCNWDLGE